MCKVVKMCTEMLTPKSHGTQLQYPSVGRGLASRGNLWAPGQVITLRFMEDDVELEERVKKYAEEWLQYANLEFLWVDPQRESQIRIAFEEGGSWSYIARDNLLVYKDTKTMNFGWLRSTLQDYEDKDEAEKEIRRVVMHEFGHMLGLQHEQVNPANNIPWNEAELLAYHAEFGWTIENVRNTYTRKFDKPDATYSRYDPESIMHYPIENKFTHGDFEVQYSYDLSPGDINFIQRLYPATPFLNL